MGIWKANVASEANAHNFVIKVAGKTETAELVQKLENRFGGRSKNIFVFVYHPYLFSFSQTIASSIFLVRTPVLGWVGVCPSWDVRWLQCQRLEYDVLRSHC